MKKYIKFFNEMFRFLNERTESDLSQAFSRMGTNFNTSTVSFPSKLLKKRQELSKLQRQVPCLVGPEMISALTKIDQIKREIDQLEHI